MRNMMPEIENDFLYKGYQCVVLFMPGGYRCGYVNVKNNENIDDIECVDTDYFDFIDCHGGITYANRGLIVFPDNHDLWIGFDCIHGGDGVDTKKRDEIFGTEKYSCFTGFGTVKTKEYVENELRMIVEQLIETERKINGKIY